MTLSLEVETETERLRGCFGREREGEREKTVLCILEITTESLKGVSDAVLSVSLQRNG